MKIIDDTTFLKYYGTLSPGEIFCYNNVYYLKTNVQENEGDFVSVNLVTGCKVSIGTHEQVLPKKAELHLI